jgi:hypothetical protein
MHKDKDSHIKGILVDPAKQTIGYIDLPERNDHALRSAINQILQTKCFVFELEFENMDVVAVDFEGHTRPRNWPFILGRFGIAFGCAIILGTNRRMNLVVSALSEINDINSIVNFGTKAFRREAFQMLEGLPALPKPLKSFIPEF